MPYDGGELVLDLNAVRTFAGLIRMAGLIVTLAVYGLFGVPAPGRLTWHEIAVGGGLVLASGVIRPLLVGTGFMLIDPKARLHDVVGTAAFNYLLWIPLLRGVLSGTDADDIVRDVIPLMFLFLPVLLGSMDMESVSRRILAPGLAAVGVVFALRWWWPGAAFRQVGSFVMPEGDGYLLNSPAVLFAAVWLPLLALERLERRPGPLSLAVTLLLCCAAVIAGSALAGAVHRAALMMAAVAVTGFAAWRAPRKPLLLALLLAGLAASTLAGGQLAGTIQQIAWKTETYGLNERSAEAAAVLEQVGASWSDLMLGQGWGTLVRSPAVGGMWVSYTHSFTTYMLLKTGLIGCLATLAYVLSMVLALLRLIRTDPSLAVALVPPLGLGLFAHTSFKYLCFGLLLTALNHGKIAGVQMLRRTACMRRESML
jgi:hypothetical protein